ncbi:unnamed protein product [Diamesa serratosioi]
MPSFCVISQRVPIPKDASITFSNMNNNLTILELSFCMFETMPMNIFVEHPKLTSFRANTNGLKQLQMINFKNANQLSFLTINNNDMTILKNSTFYYCPNLKELSLIGNNNLRSIEVATFKGLTKLLELSITGSKLDGLKNIFDVLPKLTILYANNNSLTTINENIFQYNVNLQQINLNNNEFTELPANLFDNIKELKTLRLAFNKLHTVSTYRAGEVHLYENLLKSIHITEFTTQVISYSNFIEKITCVSNLSVTSIHLSNNSLTNMNCIARMDKLTTLLLDQNKFTKLSRQSFIKLQMLIELKIADNKITKLSPQMFSPCKKLGFLDVDNFLGYKRLKQVLPKLGVLGLTTRNWNCAFLTKVVAITKNQSIYLSSNNEYTQFKYFKCQTPIWKISNDLNGVITT